MPETFYYTRNAFFAALCICAFAAFSFGQSSKLQIDLRESFKKFDLIKLDKQKALGQVQTSRSLSIPTAAGKFDLNLVPNDLRATGYRAQDTTEKGMATGMPPGLGLMIEIFGRRLEIAFSIRNIRLKPTDITRELS